MNSYIKGFEDGVRATKAEYLKLLEEESHPVKELTDEEIEECFAESCTDFKLLENGKTKGVVNIIDVGRAILRKAQEADKIKSLGTVNIGGVHFKNGKEVK